MRHLVPLLLLLLGAAGPAAHAQTELTLDATLTMAAARNPNIRAQELGVLIAQISARRAELDRTIGQLSAQAGGNAGVVKPWDAPSYGTTDASWSARATVGVPIYTGGRIDATVQRAKLGADIAGLERDLTVRDIVRAAYSAYWNIRGFELQTEALEEGLAASTQALEIIRSKAEVGMAAGVDVNRSTVDLLSQQESLLGLRATTRQAEIELAQLLDLDDDRIVLVSDPPAEKEGAVALPADPLATRPEMVRQPLAKAQAQADVRLAQSAALPSVTLTAGTGLGAVTAGGGPDLVLPTFGLVPAGNFEGSALSKPALDATIGFIVSFDPFDLLRTRQNVARARHAVDQVEAFQEAERNRLRAELSSGVIRVDTLRARMPLVQEQLRLARDNQTIVQDLYAQGSATILDLFNAQAAFRQAAIQQAGLAVDLATAELDLRWLLGEDVTTGTP